MEEVGREVVFTLFELFFRDSRLFENGDVQGELLALEHM